MMNFKDFAYLHILPHLAWLAINSLSVTQRTCVLGNPGIHLSRFKSRRLVYVLWHGRQLLFLRYMSRKNIAIMSSTSRDGRLQASILQKFGFEIIYGSSAKSPVRAMVDALRKMRAGYDIALTVDGPKGPLHKVKPGALYLAKKMDALIMPLTFSAVPNITLKSWDAYLLPKPFARAVLYFGEPFHPSPSLENTIIQEECAILEKTLNQMTQKADILVKKIYSL